MVNENCLSFGKVRKRESKTSCAKPFGLSVKSHTFMADMLPSFSRKFLSSFRFQSTFGWPIRNYAISSKNVVTSRLFLQFSKSKLWLSRCDKLRTEMISFPYLLSFTVLLIRSV